MNAMIWIPLILVLLSLAVILYIVIGKFPQLVLLNTENLQEVKEHKKKDVLLRKRAEQKEVLVNEAALKRLEPFFVFLKRIQKQFRAYVFEIEQKVQQEVKKMNTAKRTQRTPEERREQISEVKDLIQKGRRLMESGSYGEAEQVFLSAIKLDPKNAQAYQGLGDVYYENGQFEEAAETFKFTIQLDPKNEYAYVCLARLAEERNDTVKAIEWYQQAVLINDSISTRFAKLYDLLMDERAYDAALEAARQAVQLEPQNPKYLDNMLEASILVGDKNLAKEVFEQLRMVNPENQKLRSFKDRIGKMEE